MRNIWQEMKALGTNLGGRIDATNSRLDTTNTRLDETNRRIESVRVDLSARIDETNVRLDHVEGALKDLAAQQLDLTRVVRAVAERHDGELS